MADFWKNVGSFFYKLGLKALFITLTIIVGIFIIKLVLLILGKVLKKAHIDNATGNFIKSLIKSVLWLIIGFLVGYFLGIPLTALVAIVSAATVAIGLALQGSLSNLGSGIIIAVTKPFSEGDFIDTGVVSGKVVNIKLFTTELMTIDNKKIVIPNSTVTASNITNFTNQSQRMINLTIPVNYNSDLELVRKTLLQIANSNPKILKEIEPIAKLHEYSASSINFVLRAWTKTENYWDVYWQINESIIEAFRAKSIEIPYSKLDVFIKN